MQFICKMLGGSHAYGLSTLASDKDVRGVFLNTELNKVIGLDRFEHQDLKAGGADEFYFELRHFLCLLRATNTNVLELLFNDKWLFVSNEWLKVQENRFLFLDSEKMYKSLKGYMHGEKRLANGERTGKLGGKRRAAIEKFGFSPKNFVQLLRLAWAGTTFFKHGYFPVDVHFENPDFAAELLDIKLRPEDYQREKLNLLVDRWEQTLDKAFNERTVDYTFNSDAANELCCRLYGPIVANLSSNLKLNL
jgi:predicted nucleotidyltransferase